MLPRQFRRTAPTHSALRLTTSPYHPHAPLAALRYRNVAGSVASFHSTSRRREELPKSPFQTFVDVLREELRKNRELQENVKQLQGDVDKIQDSETMRRARAAYERARVRVVLRSSSSSSQCLRGLLTKADDHCIAHLEHPRKSPATGCRGGTQEARGQSRRRGFRSTQNNGRERTRSRGTRLLRADFLINLSLKSTTHVQISRATAAVSSTIASTTEPIRNTAAYKTLAETVIDALDDSGTAKHAGFEEKEARRARRQTRLAKAGKEGRIKARVVANPEYVARSFFYISSDRAPGSSILMTGIFTERARPSSCTRPRRAKSAGSS
jgi:mitochondrial import inner membrane translocase subunit TIM44